MWWASGKNSWQHNIGSNREKCRIETWWIPEHLEFNLRKQKRNCSNIKPDHSVYDLSLWCKIIWNIYFDIVYAILGLCVEKTSYKQIVKQHSVAIVCVCFWNRCIRQWLSSNACTWEGASLLAGWLHARPTWSLLRSLLMPLY